VVSNTPAAMLPLSGGEQVALGGALVSSMIPTLITPVAESPSVSVATTVNGSLVLSPEVLSASV